jgi:hypothetical protein
MEIIEQTIINKKTIEDIRDELQYINSQILTKLESGSELYKSVLAIEKYSKQSYMKIFQIDTSIEMLKQKNNTSNKHVNDINISKEKYHDMSCISNTHLSNELDRLYKDLSSTIINSQIIDTDIQEFRQSLKKYMNYFIYSIGLLLISIGVLIYKI